MSVAIPTYRRSETIVKTITQVLTLEYPPQQILVMDQTENHPEKTATKLSGMHRKGDIVWCRLPNPSIPAAMNVALIRSRCDIVLYLDDDIDITSEVAREHLAGHVESNAMVVVGRIMQPWHEQSNYGWKSGKFDFTSDTPRYINCAMAGNMSVNREQAIDVGGFDENFVRVAYRFEDDFAHRVTSRGGGIYYYPAASITHMKLEQGGTRTFGNHLTTLKPNHSVGAYYFFMRSPGVKYRIWNVCKRLLGASMTKHHLRRPWWIPVTFVSEISGFIWALRLYMKGPQYLNR